MGIVTVAMLAPCADCIGCARLSLSEIGARLQIREFTTFPRSNREEAYNAVKKGPAQVPMRYSLLEKKLLSPMTSKPVRRPAGRRSKGAGATLRFRDSDREICGIRELHGVDAQLLEGTGGSGACFLGGHEQDVGRKERRSILSFRVSARRTSKAWPVGAASYRRCF